MPYFVRFWFAAFRLATYILRSRKRETARAYALLAAIEQQYGGQFQPATRKKIAISYGIYQPMICDAFTRLHGRLTHTGEKERLVHYFICSSLFDDFTDYATITDEQLQALSFHPDTCTATTFDEKVFRQSHLLLKSQVRDTAAYTQVTEALYRAQLFSRRQQGAVLPEETLRDVTFSKGGYAVLLCRYYLDLEPGAVEEACWYRIGAIIQLTNDLYDIYKDLQDGITTLPNSMTNAYVFEQFFAVQVNNMQQLIAQLPYPPRRKALFSLAMAGIYSFGFIAIEQLKQLQGNATALPDLRLLPRHALIVDMERRKNLAQWFRQVYRHARL